MEGVVEEEVILVKLKEENAMLGELSEFEREWVDVEEEEGR